MQINRSVFQGRKKIERRKSSILTLHWANNGLSPRYNNLAHSNGTQVEHVPQDAWCLRLRPGVAIATRFKVSRGIEDIEHSRINTCPNRLETFDGVLPIDIC